MRGLRCVHLDSTRGRAKVPSKLREHASSYRIPTGVGLYRKWRRSTIPAAAKRCAQDQDRAGRLHFQLTWKLDDFCELFYHVTCLELVLTPAFGVGLVFTELAMLAVALSERKRQSCVIRYRSLRQSPQSKQLALAKFRTWCKPNRRGFWPSQSGAYHGSVADLRDRLLRCRMQREMRNRRCC
jgi:hypothetical protein